MPRHEYRSSESIPSLLTLLNEKWRYAKDFGWLMEHICDQRRPINFDQDFPILSDETRDVLAELKIQSGLACPLILQNQCFAVLFIQQVREKRVWKVDENDLIKIIADQTAIAIYQAELFAQLGRSKEAAETANRKKSEFLAIMSHELRTPLNAIIGYSEMMESGLGGRPLTDKEKKYMSNVINSGRHLLELINEILDVAKVEAGQLSLESRWIDLKTFIMDMKGTIEEMAMKKEVKLVFEIQPNIDGVKADPLRLRQIFFNLLSNAVKFNREGGSITTRISKRNDKFGEWIVCEIQDTGIGIPKNKIPELFKPFSQIDTSYARHTEGTGLGLVQTKHLIELHEGRIFVESKEGVGSTFTVMLPTHQQFPLANSETEPEQDLMLRQPI